MEYRLDAHLRKQDETEYSYCPLCRDYKRPEEMGTFNCLQCEADLEGEQLEVEKLLERFEAILEGRHDRDTGRVRDHASTRGPGIRQRSMFD